MEKVVFNSGKECEFKQFFIGSKDCRTCSCFIGIDSEEKWIKCLPYSSIQEVEKLKKENEQLRKEIGSLVDKILEMKGENNGKES